VNTGTVFCFSAFWTTAPGTLGAMADLIKFPGAASQDTDADAHASAETERKQLLFTWAEVVLRKLGFGKAIAAARTIEELRRIIFDPKSADVALVIRDALHPVSGKRREEFRGLSEGGLRAVLRNRFEALKKTREDTLKQGKQADWAEELVLDKDGKPLSNLANLILTLSNAPAWKGVLAYDEFAARVVTRQFPPWGWEPRDSPWTDHHDSLTRVWFQTKDMNPAAGDVGRAVQAAARHNPFHPIRDFLDPLVWDGTPRADSWLVTHFHADDTPYIRAIGLRFLISAVARVFRPGCKADHMLVLEGPQGKHKSEALRTLAANDAWFTDRLSHVANKDASQETAGVWIIEVAEMDALTRAASSAQKSFISHRRDRFRPPYGKHVMSFARQCVFAGTINPPENGRYLRDRSGNRRYWPVACRDTIDLVALEQARDQLWAEATAKFRAGQPWWLETPELEALATAEQALRLVIDPWTDPIADWLGDRTDVSVADVLKHVFGKAAGPGEHAAVMRVAQILKDLGFKKARMRKSGQRSNHYVREPVPHEKVSRLDL
jgi:predicted P-loop ATPase